MLFVVLAIAIGAYLFFTGGTGPVAPVADTKNIEAKIGSALSKNGADMETFSGKLPVTLEDSGVNSAIKAASFPALKRDLAALQSDAKGAQEKGLLAIYQNAVALSETKYDLLKKTQQLSIEVEGKDAAEACKYRDRLDALNIDYTTFFVSLTDLSVQGLDYSKKYGADMPLDLNTSEERGILDSISLLAGLYNENCVGVTA